MTKDSGQAVESLVDQKHFRSGDEEPGTWSYDSHKNRGGSRSSRFPITTGYHRIMSGPRYSPLKG